MRTSQNGTVAAADQLRPRYRVALEKHHRETAQTCSISGGLLRAYIVLIAPFLPAAAVLAIWYGNSLRRAVRVRLPIRQSRTLTSHSSPARCCWDFW